MALSYVWGAQPVFKTLEENFKKLKCPGELLHHWDLFLRSIQDAMHLAKLIGYRYLWIDSLCIIQDNDTDKMKQLVTIDTIYTRAALTIVAADSDDAI